MEAVGQKIVSAVRKTVLGFASDDAGLKQEGEVAVEGDFAEADDDANARESLDFIGEVGAAVADLLRLGLVAGWGAANDGGDPGVTEFKAVVAGDGAGFAGEAELMEDGIHEVARAIAGEGTAGAVGSVSSWGETEDEDAGAGVTEAGDGASPVGLVLVRAALGFADAAAVVAQPGATLTGDDRSVNLLEEWRRNLCVGGNHCIP